MSKKWVYPFKEGNAEMRDLLGGKGAGVSEMTRAGLPVPPGFTITTEACNTYVSDGNKFPEGLWEQVLKNLKDVEEQTGKKFGDPSNPLLVSVRSGAKFSMPGMMDTVLNLGLNDETLHGIIEFTGNPRFGYDALRRFIQMFSKIVLEIDPSKFEHELEAKKKAVGAKSDTDLTADDLKDVGETFKGIVKAEIGTDFPTDPFDQLRLAIQAVFRSWNNDRAIAYRNFNKISHNLGTAVNVQTMVFGNMGGGDSGTGVAFTRNPSTGEHKLFGEYLLNAQGEDVVAGIRTPEQIDTLALALPGVYEQFVGYAQMLEKNYRDMQDLEFTVERGKLYMLQTRSGKRSAAAAVKIAVNMVGEGLITKSEAVTRIEPAQIEQLLHRQIDPTAKVHIIAKGLNASPGAASGKAIFDADKAVEHAAFEKVILVRPETNPDDVHGMVVAEGILTARGGATSHAAVVARGLGKPCVAGTESIRIDMETRTLTASDGTVVREGDVITINGSTGEVIVGDVPMIEPELTEDMKQILTWADEIRSLEVWANADYPRDAQVARANGAQGIGLCRTEHMFFEEARLPIVREMILAKNIEDRKIALAKLLPIQKEDFKGIFKAMDTLPVVIRLLDPPLHEFLPHYEELLVETTELRLKGDNPTELAEKEELLKTVAQMREANPMLGLRGCRLGLIFDGVNQMQVRAILTAAVECQREGIVVKPEIMIPLVGHVNELKAVYEQVKEEAKKVFEETGSEVAFKLGTMIEVPRAALTADEIAQYAEFFSFGTNDLTQMTFGISRDDAEGKFLLDYVQRELLPTNPFQVIDRNGVGKLMRTAVQLGRGTRPDLKIGICGEHGGEPSSVEFCHMIGLNYVSCSPYRVAIARLAAAQAAISSGVEKDK